MNPRAPWSDPKSDALPRKGWRQFWRYLWLQYVNAFDEQQLRRLGNPWVMGISSVLVGAMALSLGYVPSLQRVTGLSHPWLVALLLECGYAAIMTGHFVHGWRFWLLNLVASWFWATATVMFAVLTRPPANYTGVAAYALAVVAVAGQGAFNWLFFGAYVLWPFVLSFWAPSELVLPVIFVFAIAAYGALAHGAGRQRLVLAQRDAALKEQLLLLTQRDSARSAQLLQANRLAALGRLSAGLAHELNQHIFSVRGFAQRLRRDNAERLGTGLDELQMIEQATERMSRVIDNVRRLSRAEKPRLDLIDPSEPVRQALSVVERQLIGHGIAVHWRTDAGRTPAVRANPAELEQVFLNLILNARDALCTLPSGTTRRLELGVEVKNDQVLLSVEDNGPGIAEEHRARLFEQGFTTKDAASGSGIGLWISRSFVIAAGGTIRFEPVPTGGARFIVELPSISTR